MRKRNTELLGDIIKQFFEENQSLKNKIAESRVISGWGVLFGPSIVSYTKNIYLRNNILFIHLSSSVLRAELMMCKSKIIENLNRYAGSDIVKDIIFR